MEFVDKNTALTLILIVCVVGVNVSHSALQQCVKVDDCSCQMDDGKKIDIRSLGYRDSRAPRFPFEEAGDAWMYAYNPCYAFTFQEQCKNVVACQKSPTDPTQVFGIGDATSIWKAEDNNYIVQYAHTDEKPETRTSVVTLVCDESQEEPLLDRLGSHGSTTYYFTLTSKCACPGLCEGIEPPPNPTGQPQGGISPGSVLCIIVSVLIVVYVVGGVLFMKYVRHAEGREVIPNYSIWTSLFGYMRDGFVFVFTCGKKTGYDTMT